jgi:hypothetical protein
MPVRASAVSVKRALAVAVALIVAAGVVWLARPGDGANPSRAAAAPTASQVEPAQSVTPTPTPTASPTSSCASAAHDFAPRKVTVAGVSRGIPVVTPPRDPDGVPGAPPLTSGGKTVFAFDMEQGVRPGDPAGNVLLNAHTWPDGSALGNRLLADLHRGDRIVVHGARARLCYRVTERVEVLAVDGLPRYYAKNGPPQLAIVVCSGRRLGPREWEKRTVWFASPSV